MKAVSIGPSSARIEIGRKPENFDFDRVDIVINDMGREIETINNNQFVLENLKEDYEYELKVNLDWTNESRQLFQPVYPCII